MAEFFAYALAFIGVSMTLYFGYKEATSNYLYKSKNKDTKEIIEALKTVNIYNEKGDIIKNITDVYITRWDKRIYIIKDKNKKQIMKLNIAENMMLVIHNTEDSDSNGECKYFKEFN